MFTKFSDFTRAIDKFSASFHSTVSFSRPSHPSQHRLVSEHRQPGFLIPDPPPGGKGHPTVYHLGGSPTGLLLLAAKTKGLYALPLTKDFPLSASGIRCGSHASSTQGWGGCHKQRAHPSKPSHLCI